jgi:hypothetical protein
MALELEPTPLRGDKHDCLDWGRVRRYWFQHGRSHSMKLAKKK